MYSDECDENVTNFWQGNTVFFLNDEELEGFINKLNLSRNENLLITPNKQHALITKWGYVEYGYEYTVEMIDGDSKVLYD